MSVSRPSLEWSILRSWVRDWFRYCRWYFLTAMSPEVTIEEFFKAPVVHSDWSKKRKQKCWTKPNPAIQKSYQTNSRKPWTNVTLRNRNI